MRITPTIQGRNFLELANETKTRLDRAQEQLSSGKRVNRLSDDPHAASQASQVSATISTNEQYIATNDLLHSKLEFTDSLLQNLNQLVDAAQVAGAQALSGTSTPTTRVALSTEVDGIKSQALSIGNKQFNGTFLFSGTLTNTEPFADSPAGVTFSGNDEALYLRLDATTVIKTNITNQDLFAGSPPLFATLEGLKTAIANNDTAAIRQHMDELEQVSTRVNTVATVVGNDLNLVDQVKAAVTNHNFALTREKGRLTDANLVEVISSAELAQQSLTMTLQAQGRIQQLSLIDFLR